MKAIRNQSESSIKLHIHGDEKPPLVLDAGESHNLSDQELLGVQALAFRNEAVAAQLKPSGDVLAALVLLDLDGHGFPIEPTDEKPAA